MDVIVRCTLRDQRIAKGLSLRQLEAMSGINRSMISRYETDEHLMPIDRAALFALLLGCTLDDLYTYEVAGEA